MGVRHRGESLVVEVWDTGLGIPQDKQKIVFRFAILKEQMVSITLLFLVTRSMEWGRMSLTPVREPLKLSNTALSIR